jgi:hypothetical protein
VYAVPSEVMRQGIERTFVTDLNSRLDPGCRSLVEKRQVHVMSRRSGRDGDNPFMGGNTSQW